MTAYFQKRTYTPATLIRDLWALIPSLHRLASGKDRERLDRAFIERVMLAVTQVNDCRYCAYAHQVAATKAGVTSLEIDAVMRGEFQGAPTREQYALQFAGHYAEQGGLPGPGAVAELVEVYGDVTAARIIAYIRMITLGNLLGNTFDALLSRLRGRPAQSGNALSEVGVLVSASLLLPLIVLALFPSILLNRFLM